MTSSTLRLLLRIVILPIGLSKLQPGFLHCLVHFRKTAYTRLDATFAFEMLRSCHFIVKKLFAKLALAHGETRIREGKTEWREGPDPLSPAIVLGRRMCATAP